MQTPARAYGILGVEVELLPGRTLIAEQPQFVVSGQRLLNNDRDIGPSGQNHQDLYLVVFIPA